MSTLHMHSIQAMSPINCHLARAVMFCDGRADDARHLFARQTDQLMLVAAQQLIPRLQQTRLQVNGCMRWSHLGQFSAADDRRHIHTT
jgi:hypothetical protein